MLPEPLLAQLQDMLTRRTGIGFSGNGARDFERRIAAAGEEAGAPDVEDYVRRLLAAPLQRAEIERLAHHFTVGETYFFREKNSFEALEQVVLPALLRARATSRRLRFWSAGCCTGEEAYSIAILLDRILPDQSGWNIEILATDINQQFLRKARKGVYGEWSFRGTPVWVREGYFRKKRNGNFELLPRIRERVEFSYLNLADDVYPAASNNTAAVDIIFCRNVLMYFAGDQVRRVVARFRAALREDGLLLVSPAETSSTLFPDYSPINFPGAIFYRPGNAPLPETSARPNAVAATPRRPAAAAQRPANVARSAAPARRGQPSESSRSSADPEDAASAIRTARIHANEGRLDEAAQWCAKAIAADKLKPSFHYLLATVEQERGDSAAAAQALQRALYLDPDFVLAHFALGNLRLAEGRRDEAARHFENIQRLIRGRSRDDVLPESDGLTAGRMGEIVASLATGIAVNLSDDHGRDTGGRP